MTCYGSQGDRHVQKISALLQCTPSEAFRLSLLGGLEYAPEIVGAYVERIEKDLAEARQDLGKPMPSYKIGKVRPDSGQREGKD